MGLNLIYVKYIYYIGLRHPDVTGYVFGVYVYSQEVKWSSQKVRASPVAYATTCRPTDPVYIMGCCTIADVAMRCPSRPRLVLPLHWAPLQRRLLQQNTHGYELWLLPVVTTSRYGLLPATSTFYSSWDIQTRPVIVACEQTSSPHLWNRVCRQEEHTAQLEITQRDVAILLPRQNK